MYIVYSSHGCPIFLMSFSSVSSPLGDIKNIIIELVFLSFFRYTIFSTTLLSFPLFYTLTFILKH